MKKFSVILIALAFVASMVVPAMAGDFAIKGGYTLDAESRSQGDNESAWYDDDLDVDIDVTQGAVKFHWDIEVSDGFMAGHVNSATSNLVDGYYVQYAYNDAITVKAGEWGLGFGRAIGMDNQGGGNLGGTYSMDTVDLSLWLGKVLEEGSTLSADDEDTNQIQFVANLKEAGPFTKLVGTYLSHTVEGTPDVTNTFMGVDIAVPAGPVALSGEIGALGGDTSEGTYFLIEAGLADLVDFDLNVAYFSADSDFGVTGVSFGEDYDVTYLFGDVYDAKWARVKGSYPVNDDVTIGAAFVFSAEDDAGTDLGSPYDFWGTYKLADNASTTFTYGTDGAATGDALTGMRLRLAFKF